LQVAYNANCLLLQNLEGDYYKQDEEITNRMGQLSISLGDIIKK